MRKLVMLALLVIICSSSSSAGVIDPVHLWDGCLFTRNGGDDAGFVFGTSYGVTGPLPVKKPYNPQSCMILEERKNGESYAADICGRLSPGQTHVWYLTMYVVPNDYLKTIYLCGLNDSKGHNLDVSLWLSGTKIWDMDENDTFSKALPAVDSANPYNLEIRATALPEPASLYGIATGLIGLGGILLRRRKYE